MKLDPVTWVKELPPQKLLNLILILAVMALFAWLKILIGSDSSDKKEALTKCEQEKYEIRLQMQAINDKWSSKYDSVRTQQYNDKINTIEQLQRTLDKTRLINKKINKQK